MARCHALGAVINEAIRIAPSANAAEPKSFHVALAERVWDSVVSNEVGTEFVTELNRVMNFLLTQSKRKADTERAVWFMSFVFGRMLDAGEASQRSAANSFLCTLCDRSRCENKTIRFRTVQCLRMGLESLPPEAEIDDAVAETVFATLTSRIRDRSYDVRTQALLALDRFKIPGVDEEYREDPVANAYLISLRSDPHPKPRAAIFDCLPLVPRTIEAICERTADVSEVVRVHAFKAITLRVTPDVLGEALCGKVLRNGLCDRSELVRRLGEQLLLKWFDHSAQLRSFFGLVDVETDADLFPQMVEVLLRHRLEAVSSWSQNTRFEGSADDGIGDVLFWKAFLCGCKRRGEAVGRMAATDSEKAAEAQELFDLVDRLLPAAVKDFVKLLVEALEKGCFLYCQHLLEILTQCFNFTEEGDQQTGARLFAKLCGLERLETAEREWYVSVVGFGCTVWPEPSDFVQTTMQILEVPFSAVHRYVDLAEGSDRLRHWIRLSVEMLRAIPLQTQNVLRFGTPSFKLADLLQNFMRLLAATETSSVLVEWLIEGTGCVLALEKMPAELEACWPLFRKAFWGPDSGPATAAAHALTTLCMTHGVRSIDEKPSSRAAAPSLWKCPVLHAMAEESPSPPICFAQLLHWDTKLQSELQRALVQGLCRLLVCNDGHGSLGMPLEECIQCLCPLVVIFVYEEEDPVQNAHLQQLLKIFFDRYAQVSMQHQYLLRAGFLPILRHCLEVSVELRLPIASAVKFLANLLLAPLRGKPMTEEEREAHRRQISQQNLELMYVLLWEILKCPAFSSDARVYVSALWKAIADLRVEGATEVGKQQLLLLLQDRKCQKCFTPRQLEILQAKLGPPNAELSPHKAGNLETLKEELGTYIRDLGTYPFSEDDDDDM